MPLPSESVPCVAVFVVLFVVVFCCAVVDPEGAKTVEEGGRQNSSKTSARREVCRWMYVAEESRDIVFTRSAELGDLVRVGEKRLWIEEYTGTARRVKNMHNLPRWLS